MLFDPIVIMDLQYFESIRRTFDLKTLPMFLNMSRYNSSPEELMLLMREMKRSAEKEHTFPYSTRVILITLYTLMALVGASANLFISVVILFSKKLLRNPSNVLVLNLMMSGILMSIFCIPFTLMSVTNRSWIFGSFLCKMIPSLQSTSIFVCSATIAMISVDRLVRVTKNVPSHSYNRVFARTHWIVMLAETFVIWILSAGVSVPIAYYQTIIQVGSEEVGYQKCVEMWPSESVKGIYAITFMVVHYLGPSVIIMACHLEIKSHLEGNMRSSDTSVHSINGTNQSCANYDEDLSDGTNPQNQMARSDNGLAGFDHDNNQMELANYNLSLPVIAIQSSSNFASSSNDDEITFKSATGSSSGPLPCRRSSNPGVVNTDKIKPSYPNLTKSDQNFSANHLACRDGNHNVRPNGICLSPTYKFGERKSKSCRNPKCPRNLQEPHRNRSCRSIQRSSPHPYMSNNNKNNSARRSSLNRCQSSPEMANHASYYVREIDRNKQVTKTLVYIILCFIITWLPWNLFNIFLDFEPDPKMTISDIYLILAVCHLIAMTTIPLNAFWYGWANPNIRVEALKFLEKISRRLLNGFSQSHGQQNGAPGSHV